MTLLSGPLEDGFFESNAGRKSPFWDTLVTASERGDKQMNFFPALCGKKEKGEEQLQDTDAAQVPSKGRWLITLIL